MGESISFYDDEAHEDSTQRVILLKWLKWVRKLPQDINEFYISLGDTPSSRFLSIKLRYWYEGEMIYPSYQLEFLYKTKYLSKFNLPVDRPKATVKVDSFGKICVIGPFVDPYNDGNPSFFVKPKAKGTPRSIERFQDQPFKVIIGNATELALRVLVNGFYALNSLEDLNED